MLGDAEGVTAGAPAVATAGAAGGATAGDTAGDTAGEAAAAAAAMALNAAPGTTTVESSLATLSGIPVGRGGVVVRSRSVEASAEAVEEEEDVTGKAVSAGTAAVAGSEGEAGAAGAPGAPGAPGTVARGSTRLAAVIGGMRSSGMPAGVIRVASGSIIGSSAGLVPLSGLGKPSGRDIKTPRRGRMPPHAQWSLSLCAKAMNQSHLTIPARHAAL